jgi:hypothetical protein
MTDLEYEVSLPLTTKKPGEQPAVFLNKLLRELRILLSEADSPQQTASWLRPLYLSRSRRKRTPR